MNVYIPGGLIAIFIVFYISLSHNRRVKAKREERKDRLNNQTQELLNYLTKSQRKNETDNSAENHDDQ